MRKENPVIPALDIRIPEAFKKGHTPMIIIDFKAEKFESELRKLDRKQTYFIHCRNGPRSGLA